LLLSGGDNATSSEFGIPHIVSGCYIVIFASFAILFISIMFLSCEIDCSIWLLNKDYSYLCFIVVSRNGFCQVLQHLLMQRLQRHQVPLRCS